ncbi:hypothetical protein J8273_0655 [Carpediemonas membranifera]|uniref:Uncharacterized protein n=1 Tax=Carpediemonas membranifera TaxID=201153 RepID=A0A8J6EBK6_9EUKA|nr:hypothetical protein J8273_0655 [Carpediemonas membranifera]|eukprot:KAG9397525.1 hypothetical protein J8273_0655 [Carpediemonas membranifera]
MDGTKADIPADLKPGSFEELVACMSLSNVGGVCFLCPHRSYIVHISVVRGVLRQCRHHGAGMALSAALCRSSRILAMLH